MNDISENSSAVYDELIKTVGAKCIKSLNNIKSACDLIEISHGIINYSRVAKVATEHFGGPKAQSIHNNAKLKRYIDSRILEYSNIKNRNTKQVREKSICKNYPSDNLDLRTRKYIDQLHDRLNLVETRYKTLRDWQEKFTKINPIDSKLAIMNGPDHETALKIEYSGDSELLTLIKRCIQRLIELPNYHSDFIIETKKLDNIQKKRLSICNSNNDMVNYVLLTPDMLDACNKFLAEI